MDWNEDSASHSHMGDNCHHGHGGHSHSHGPRVAAFSGMAHGFMPAFHGQFGKNADQVMESGQQPKKRSHMDDSSSWDIVKATQFGILERCKELVEAGYDVRQPDKENVSLLHWAAINNRSEMVKYYMSKGAVIDQLGGDLNSTPLHWAIRQGHLSMVIQLLRFGADPSIADGEGYRSLHLAILFQHMAIAAYLMAKGQEVDGPDCNGQTPLMLAAQKIIGPEPTNFLIKNNASVSAVDKVNRNTPLHCAVLAGNVDAAHILLEAGASVDAENINGHTPIDLAHQVHSPLLIHMLNHIKQERIRSSSRCLRIVNRYRVFLQFLLCVAVFGSVGAIVDMNSESWLLKGILLACVIGVVNLASRNFPSPAFQSLLPATALMASVFWMLVTWCLWFLPDGPSATVQVLFTVNATALLYYYLRTCRTDPGFVKATEEEKKMNVLMLAEAGCLDPRIFCTSCMIKKPMRTNHCFTCDACVAKQDHHSIWTNSCIGARNHHFFVLFLFSLLMMGVWMFYGCLVCELVEPLSPAVRGAGSVGRGVGPGGLLPLGAQRLLPGLLPHILVLRHPAAAALPDCVPGPDHSREDQPDATPEETPTIHLSETEPLQSGCCEEPGVLLPAAVLRTLQAGRHRLDPAVPSGPRPAHVRTPRHGLTPLPSDPRPTPPPTGSGVRFYKWFWTKSTELNLFIFLLFGSW